MNIAFKYFKDNFAMLESEYPYTSAPKDAPSTDCHYSASEATNVKVKSTRNSNHDESCEIIDALLSELLKPCLKKLKTHLT